jgi:hypothetical protein
MTRFQIQDLAEYRERVRAQGCDDPLLKFLIIDTRSVLKASPTERRNCSKRRM